MKKRIIACVILFFLLIPGVYVYVKDLEIVETARILLMSVAAYGVLAATMLNIWNSWDASLNILDSVKFQKIDNSFRYIERWDNASLKEARDFTRKLKKVENERSSKELLCEINENSDLERSVIAIFNFFEEIYMAIDNNRVESAILKEVFSQVYCDLYLRFEFWRKDRSERKQNLKGMDKLDSLYKKWL